MSTVFQDEDHEAKIDECAVRVFVLPSVSNRVATSSSLFEKGLQGYNASSACARSSDFCTQSGAGYTDTEDCDGDGVLDHYCYAVGDTLTPSYEAFISSRDLCNVVEDKSCSRSVLPGRRFGCQRPLGWCMHGEHYKRDVDCDGDGHFDHVCETPNHNGFISSSQDCIDTWEEGQTGKKCEPRAPLLTEQDGTVTYKLVVDSGSCVQHGSSTCVKSHPDWPNTNYPTTGCRLHVEWITPQANPQGAVGCDAEVASNQTLCLEMLHMDVEKAHFSQHGYSYGDRFDIGGILVDSDFLNEVRYKVQDRTAIMFNTDLSVERRGWLACLRLRTKKPKVYSAKCTEIGDDIWAGLDIEADEQLVVQCDMTKCRKEKVSPFSREDDYRFQRTANVCDAGWQATKSSKFTISFSNPLRTKKGTFETGSFVIGF